MQVSITSLQALTDALGFVARTWRRVWGVQTLAASGVALTFVGTLAAIDPDLAADLKAIGLAITMVTFAPLVGALLRLQVGGEAERTLGPSGLQFGRAEARLGGAIVAGFVAGLVAWLPMVAITAAIVVAFRGLGLVELRGLGATPLSFVIVAACAVTVATAQAYALARLALVLPDAIERGRLDPVAGWRLGTGAEAALCGGLWLSVTPTVLMLTGMVWLGAHGAGWAWPDAVVGGVLFAGTLTFVQAPLCVGVLGAVYRAQISMPSFARGGQRFARRFAALRL